jgi:hypothetical protein
MERRYPGESYRGASGLSEIVSSSINGEVGSDGPIEVESGRVDLYLDNGTRIPVPGS